MIRVAGLMKIDQIHRCHHITDQGDLSDLRLTAHRTRHRDGPGCQRELSLPGVEQTRCQEPAAYRNVPPALTAQGTNRLGTRRPGAGSEGRHARQPVVRRPLPGSPRHQGIAPDIGTAGGCEDEPIEL